MTSLRLALRGLVSRAGFSASLLVVAAFAVAVSAAGGIYLRAAGESVLTDTLAEAPPSAAGIGITQLVRSPVEIRQLDQTVAAARPVLPALRPPVTGLESRTPLPVTAPGLDFSRQAMLASRSDLCDHLRLSEGRCPRFASLDTPAEAAVSQALAASLRLRVGARLQVANFSTGLDPRQLRVVGIYAPNRSDPGWFGDDAVYFPVPDPFANDPQAEAVFVDPRDMLAVVGASIDVVARRDLVTDTSRLRLRDATTAPVAVATFQRAVKQSMPDATVHTNLPNLIQQAERGRQALSVPVLLAAVELGGLALLILVIVAAMAAEARAGEIALAKLRGATCGQAFALATLELALVSLMALPAGLALGWAGTGMLAETQLAAGTPVVVTPPAILSAIGAAVVGLGAASVAGLSSVRRRVLDQWRHARSDRVGRRGLLLEVVLAGVAVAALVNLRSAGIRRAGGVDVLAALAPALAILTGALLVGRLLPLTAGAVVRTTTTRSRGMALFIGARQVARRGGAALRVVIALAAAFGLVAFALTIRQDLARNRHDRAWTEVGADAVATPTFGRGDLGPERVAAADPDGSAAMAAMQAVYGPRDVPTVDVNLLGVQPERYPAVGFWRSDFAEAPLDRLLGPLRSSGVPPVDLGQADQLEVDLGVENLRVDGRVFLVAEVRGPTGRVSRVRLGQLAEGASIAPRRARLDPSRIGPGPYRLQRLSLVRDTGVITPVTVTLVLDTVRAHRAGGWVRVDGFDDPKRWYSSNVADYTPDDALTGVDGQDGKALQVAVSAPATAYQLGVAHASMPRSLPAVVTAALLQQTSARIGQVIPLRGSLGGEIDILPVALARVLPGTRGGSPAAMVNLDQLLFLATRDPTDQVAANQVWTVGGAKGAAVLRRLGAQGVAVAPPVRAADRAAVLAHQAPSLALLLLLVGAAAGAVLATVGVMLHLYLTGRRRAFELAVLEAFGARQRSLWGPMLVEQGSLVGYGVLCGGAIGLVVALVALPAVPQFIDNPEVPPPIYTPDWPWIGGALGLALLLVMGGLALVVAALVRRARPSLLREEEL
jgi:predicted lysophospholipase L1 biosynthesis ABC-type transport system permease subunit